MARIDKTDSAVGIVRGVLKADIAAGDLDGVIGVGFDAAGLVVKGAGKTGIVGVMNPSKFYSKAGSICDVMVLGDILDHTGLAAGTTYWADGTTGALAADGAAGAAPATGAGSTAGSAKIGFTTSADHLVIRL